MQGHPVVERYLACFETSINEFDFPEREEITHEIRNHIAEAHAAGEELDAVLQTLGPADVLARAYAVELALNPHAKRRVRTPGGVLKAAAAAGMRGVSTLGRFPKAIVSLGMRGVRTLGRFSKAGLSRCIRGVRTLGRSPKAILPIGVRGVRALGRFLRASLSMGMRVVRTLGRFLRAVVAAGTRRVRTLGGFLRVAAMVTAGSLVGTVIGAAGIGFTLSGLFLLVSGTLEAAGLHVANFQSGMSPAEAMTLGPVVMVAGGAALLIFRLYIQFVLTALKKVFPAARGIELARAFSS